jgi:hypothetical protein
MSKPKKVKTKSQKTRKPTYVSCILWPGIAAALRKKYPLLSKARAVNLALSKHLQLKVPGSNR